MYVGSTPCTSAPRIWYQVQTDTSEVGGSEPNREIVSFRSCVRMRGLVVRSELGKMIAGPLPFAFSFLSQDGSSCEFYVVLVSPSEI